MANQLHDTGEEYVTSKLDGETYTVGLYDESTDQLADGDDIGDITTEPTDGNYERQSATFVHSDQSGDWGIGNQSQMTFDVRNTTGYADSAFVLVNFASTDAGDGGTAKDHLLFTVPLGNRLDLGSVHDLNVNVDLTLS